MLLLAHAGFAAFFARYLPAPAFLAGFAALLPDLVDKGFFLLGLAPSTRFLGHTLLFGPALALLAFAALRRRGPALAVLFGTWSHLLLDGEHFLPLLYPFTAYAWPVSTLSVAAHLTPLELAFEAFGLAALAFVWHARRSDVGAVPTPRPTRHLVHRHPSARLRVRPPGGHR